MAKQAEFNEFRNVPFCLAVAPVTLVLGLQLPINAQTLLNAENKAMSVTRFSHQSLVGFEDSFSKNYNEIDLGIDAYLELNLFSIYEEYGFSSHSKQIKILDSAIFIGLPGDNFECDDEDAYCFDQNNLGILEGTVIEPQSINGSAGNIEINDSQLQISNGATISSSTTNTGDAGSIRIDAHDSINFQNGSQITSTTFDNGNAGNFQLNVSDQLIISRPSAETSDTGIAGNIEINTSQSQSSIDYTFLSTSIRGTGGNLIFDIATLTLTNDSRISTEISGTGNGGSIAVNSANPIFFDEDFQNSTSGIPVEASGTGNAGDINISRNILVLPETDLIPTTTAETATNPQGRGRVTISTDLLAGFDNCVVPSACLPIRYTNESTAIPEPVISIRARLSWEENILSSKINILFVPLTIAFGEIDEDKVFESLVFGNRISIKKTQFFQIANYVIVVDPI